MTTWNIQTFGGGFSGWSPMPEFTDEEEKQIESCIEKLRAELPALNWTSDLNHRHRGMPNRPTIYDKEAARRLRVDDLAQHLHTLDTDVIVLQEIMLQVSAFDAEYIHWSRAFQAIVILKAFQQHSEKLVALCPDKDTQLKLALGKITKAMQNLLTNYWQQMAEQCHSKLNDDDLNESLTAAILEIKSEALPEEEKQKAVKILREDYEKRHGNCGGIVPSKAMATGQGMVARAIKFLEGVPSSDFAPSSASASSSAAASSSASASSADAASSLQPDGDMLPVSVTGSAPGDASPPTRNDDSDDEAEWQPDPFTLITEEKCLATIRDAILHISAPDSPYTAALQLDNILDCENRFWGILTGVVEWESIDGLNDALAWSLDFAASILQWSGSVPAPVKARQPVLQGNQGASRSSSAASSSASSSSSTRPTPSTEKAYGLALLDELNDSLGQMGSTLHFTVPEDKLKDSDLEVIAIGIKREGRWGITPASATLHDLPSWIENGKNSPARRAFSWELFSQRPQSAPCPDAVTLYSVHAPAPSHQPACDKYYKDLNDKIETATGWVILAGDLNLAGPKSAHGKLNKKNVGSTFFENWLPRYSVHRSVFSSLSMPKPENDANSAVWCQAYDKVLARCVGSDPRDIRCSMEAIMRSRSALSGRRYSDHAAVTGSFTWMAPQSQSASTGNTVASNTNTSAGTAASRQSMDFIPMDIDQSVASSSSSSSSS